MRTFASDSEIKSMELLQERLLRCLLFSLVVVAVSGLMLRGMQIGGRFPFTFKNMLHGHSHFAFGGWLTPLIVWMVLRYNAALREGISYRHWRNIVVILLVSAYGMLFSFPVQGYAPVSIIFSTLSVAGSFYLAYMIWTGTRGSKEAGSMFLKAAAFFMVISTAGPLATGPIIAAGKAGSPLYYNAIYYYLHFQYNGWFVFALLSFLVGPYFPHRAGRRVFYLMLSGCFLSLPLSFLWNDPRIPYQVIGGAGGLLQAVGMFVFLRYFQVLGLDMFHRGLIRVSVISLLLKCALQLLSAIPAFGEYAFSSHNIVIAYLHLVMIGCISTFGFSAIYNHAINKRALRIPFSLFISAFAATEILLVADGLGYSTKIIGGFTYPALFLFSTFLPLSATLLFISHLRSSFPSLTAQLFSNRNPSG